MNCRELIDFLDAYVDGGLDAVARAEFESHLTCCAHCRDFLATYRDTIELSRSLVAGEDRTPPAAVPEELVRAVLRTRERPS